MGGEGESADMCDVVEGALCIHDYALSSRLALAGLPAACGARSTLSLAFMVHELATNAAKHGALSEAVGEVPVTWALTDASERRDVTFTWRERGGPTVATPTRKGFGSRLIERGLAGTIGGEVTMDYDAAGVRCTLKASLREFES